MWYRVVVYTYGIQRSPATIEVVAVTAEYVTSEEHLPDDLTGEVTIQVTDSKTKEIFTTRARIDRSPDTLESPDSLTIVRGPHENVEEQWYIDIIETDVTLADIDAEVLRDCIQRSQDESNVVNARSDELRALLLYLVETGRYQSVSEAVRSILGEYLSDRYPELVDSYVDVRTELEREELATRLGGEE
ncbi:hypothetical protein SAMN04487948_11059 [Halogranum amylolyticum]|uniref:Uncharacterized protein n=2 Tax=Halogranum amylolyticum TaxID=660520 RepID=A0A1H8UC59_9EURY|nr:hypothetical protein SAMN04487948_11059 [Halogranum amylolyticum]